MDPQQPIDQQQMEKCAQLVAKANRVVFFTGAGMSAESGIGTFRGGGGLWSGLLGAISNGMEDDSWCYVEHVH